METELSLCILSMLILHVPRIHCRVARCFVPTVMECSNPGSSRRNVRSGDWLVAERRRFRRSACKSCGRTHVLIPHDTLVRRRDSVAVIGAQGDMIDIACPSRLNTTLSM
jgi:hypothetical protein